MRVERHKKELYFFGWALVSGLLLAAAARANDATYTAPAPVGPPPANSSSSSDILRRARGALPADQYDAFEKAMKKLDGQSAGPSTVGPTNPNRAGPPNEAVIDGSAIPSTITFDRPGTVNPQGVTAQQPVQQPVAVQPTAEPERAPAEAPPVPSTNEPPQPAPLPEAKPKDPTPAAPAAPAKPGAKPAPKPSKATQFYDPSLPSPDPVK